MRIGVDVGGTNLAAGLLDDSYNIICKDSVPANGKRPDVEIVEDIIMLCQRLIDKANLTAKDIESIGIGIPGYADSKAGVVGHCANINLNNIPLSKMIKDRLGVPVFLGNDADCAALGEAIAGATADASNSVMITIGTGIGGGIIINKKIYDGFNHIGGELGHMVIVKGGKQCNCGRKGCWEAYGSATALVAQTKEAVIKNPDSILAGLVENDVDRVNGKTPFDALDMGCPVAKEVVDNYIDHFSTGLTNVINIFQPEKVVIGGGISNQGARLIDAISRFVNEERYDREVDVPKTVIQTAVLGNDAGIIGAAALGA